MKRYIPIESCTDCPHLSHGGAFGKVAYIPVCGKHNGAALPFRLDLLAVLNRVAASYTGEIPDWCPLPQSKGGL